MMSKATFIDRLFIGVFMILILVLVFLVLVTNTWALLD